LPDPIPPRKVRRVPSVGDRPSPFANAGRPILARRRQAGIKHLDYDFAEGNIAARQTQFLQAEAIGPKVRLKHRSLAFRDNR
jgi:hypothetical protein